MPINSHRPSASTAKMSRDTGLPGITLWTIMGWMRIAVDRNAISIFGECGETFGGDRIRCGTTSNGTTLNLQVIAAGASGTGLSVGPWNHVALTCEGTGTSQVKMWLNGKQDASLNGSTLVSAGRIAFCGNNLLDALEWLDGCIASMSVWNVPLAQPDIIHNMFSFRPVGPVHQLNGWYPCRHGPYHVGRDESVSMNHMTVVGDFLNEPGPPKLAAA